MITKIQKLHKLLENQEIDVLLLKEIMNDLQTEINQIEDKATYKSSIESFIEKVQIRKVNFIKATHYEMAANMRDIERKLISLIS